MSSIISSHRALTATAAFGVVSLLFAFNAGSANGGDLLGGVAGAVAGALGGGGSGGGDAAPDGAAGAGTGAMGVSAGSAQSARDTAIGTNKKLKRVVTGKDEERCGNTLFDFLRRPKCDDWRTARVEADGDEFDQASTSPVDEPLMRKPKAAKKAVNLQPPARKKATAPKQTARLNIEKPAVEKPRLSIAPKLIEPDKPDTVEKPRPKAEPALSCAKAGAIVGDYGFSAISPADCEGRVYAFDASRDGKSFTVTLNAVSGELIEVRKLP